MTDVLTSVAPLVISGDAHGPALRLDPAAQALYRQLQRTGPVSASAARRLLLEFGEEPLRQLAELGLVREHGRGIAGVPREEVIDRLLTEQTELLQTALGEVNRRHRVLRTLLQSGPELDGDGAEQVRTVSLQAGDQMSAVPARPRRELLAIQPGGRFPRAVLEQSLRHARDSVEAGVSLRVVHQTNALAHAEVVTYLRALEELGARVRVRENVPFRMLMVDREAAFCEAPTASSAEEAFLIRGPRVMSLLERVFESAWVDSTPVRTALGGRRGAGPAPASQRLAGSRSAAGPVVSPVGAADLDDEVLARRYAQLTPQQQLILRYLAEGQTDRMIARRAAVTPRTVTRRVAEIYRVLGVESRFQAGVVAQRLGMV